MSRPTRAEIDLTALGCNYRKIRAQVGAQCEILAVVKADAYGHGVKGIAPALAAAGADQFAVALVREAIELRQLGLSQPIVVLGGVFPGDEEAVVALQLNPVIYDLDMARRLHSVAVRLGRVVACHLKVDTGMGRLGFSAEQLDEVLQGLSGLSGLSLLGVMSHLAAADEPQRPLTERQLAAFHQILRRIEAAGYSLRYRHIANSAAIYSRELAGCNLVRPGIALYGGLTGATATEPVDQRPVMRLISALAQIKEIAAGAGVSYGHRFIAARRSRIAAVPVGYADGYNRLLSNCGQALIGGRRVPVVGTVCMDWTLVDVTDLPAPRVGDSVVLLGRDGDAVITAEEWADRVGSITYEVFCNISKRVPRLFVGEAEPGTAGSPG